MDLRFNLVSADDQGPASGQGFPQVTLDVGQGHPARDGPDLPLDGIQKGPALSSQALLRSSPAIACSVRAMACS
ncbi:MAG: hypothetical protein GY792_36305 [Gammaproteobacteria bacterium]|nr:hypothetical protein [Gammaproteobacteria bacterium]